MTVVTMVRCDNPACESVGAPEWVRAPGERRRKGQWDDASPPYGWLYLEGSWFGSGPDVKIMVCSIECVGPALVQQSEQERNQ